MVRCLSRPDEFEIVSISWPKPRVVEALQGARFLGSGGLVAASLKARHSLPYGEICSQGQTVFAKDLSFEPSTLMILPLVWNDEPIGALLVADPRPRKLNHEVRDMLHVIADHAAIAIANGQMYQQMEELATTDGLTGLVNHRHFQELFDVGLKSAARYQRNYALILCDLDHFKSVNDTYGHPVGDAVLKRISSVLKRSARGTDIVARYGGEEFAILMDETDATGATTIAERIRNLVKQELFHSEIGSFRCSMSLGISVFPLHSSIKTELLVAADEGLYEAKRAGRDRVVLAKFPTTRKKAG